MQDTLTSEIKRDEPYEHIPYSVGRQYVMDWRNEALEDKVEIITEIPAETETTEETEETEHSPIIADSRALSNRAADTGDRQMDRRLLWCVIAAVLGIAVGVLIGTMFPLEAAPLEESVTDTTGGFWGVLVRRLIHTGGFLFAAYLLGYFAAGGVLVWAVPLCCGLGTGLSAAGLCLAGGNLWLFLPYGVSCVVISFAACVSGEFSSLILRLVSSRGEVIASGGAAHRYTMRFAVYLLVILAAAITEAAILLS